MNRNIRWFVWKEIFSCHSIFKFIHTRFVPNILISNNHITASIRNIIWYICTKHCRAIRTLYKRFKSLIHTFYRSNNFRTSLTRIRVFPSNCINSIFNIRTKLFPCNYFITSFISPCGLISKN